MTESETIQAIHDLDEATRDTMDCVLDLVELMGDEVTIPKLSEALKLAVADGWDMLEIHISMIHVAILLARGKITEADMLKEMEHSMRTKAVDPSAVGF